MSTAFGATASLFNSLINQSPSIELSRTLGPVALSATFGERVQMTMTQRSTTERCRVGIGRTASTAQTTRG